jgi:hypothetical protein
LAKSGISEVFFWKSYLLAGACTNPSTDLNHYRSCNVTVNIFIARLTLRVFSDTRSLRQGKTQCPAAQVCTGGACRVYCAQTTTCVSCDAAFNSYLSFKTHKTKVCGRLNKHKCSVHNRLLSKQSCLSTAPSSKWSFNMCKSSVD